MTDQPPEDQEKTQAPASDSQPVKKKKSGRKRLLLLLLPVVILMAASAFFLQYVRPDEFGIKVVRIGLQRGVHEKIYSPGLHLVLPFGMEEMYRIPKNIQVLELTNHPGSAAQFARVEKAAHIQTSDGFYVDVDVSILYRIVDAYKVFTIIGPGELFITNGIVPQAEPRLKDAMGELTTEEFYNSPLRVEKTELARQMLNKNLTPKGIEVDQVLVRYFTYSDEIQRNIEEKKLKDQLVFKNQAEARAAIEEAALKKIVQEGIATVKVEMEKGQAYATQRRAEKDLYARKRKAEANLLVQLAEAEKVRLKNEALSGQGAERLIGLKMAETYRGLEAIILPSDGPSGVNPLDLGNSLKLFEVRKGGAK